MYCVCSMAVLCCGGGVQSEDGAYGEVLMICCMMEMGIGYMFVMECM